MSLSRLAFAVLVGGFYGYVIGYLANDTTTVAYHIAAMDFSEADAYLHAAEMLHYRKHEWGLIGSVAGTVVAFVVCGFAALSKRTRWKIVRRD